MAGFDTRQPSGRVANIEDGLRSVEDLADLSGGIPRQTMAGLPAPRPQYTGPLDDAGAIEAFRRAHYPEMTADDFRKMIGVRSGPSEAFRRGAAAGGLDLAGAAANTVGGLLDFPGQAATATGDTTGGAPAAEAMHAIGQAISPATDAAARQLYQAGDWLHSHAEGARNEPAGLASTATGILGETAPVLGAVALAPEVGPEAYAAMQAGDTFRRASQQGDQTGLAAGKAAIAGLAAEAGGRIPLSQPTLAGRVATGAGIGAGLPYAQQGALHALDPNEPALPPLRDPITGALLFGTMGALHVPTPEVPHSRGAELPTGKEAGDNGNYQAPAPGGARIEPTFDPTQGPQVVVQGGPFADISPAAPEPSAAAPVPPTPEPATVQPESPKPAPAAPSVSAGAGLFDDVPPVANPAGSAEAPKPAPASVGVPAALRAPYDVVTPRGRRVPVQNEIVEADSLVPSHTPDLNPNPAFPAELQPRDRGRAASQEQVARIAGNLTPELLGPSVSATEGAPIVGPDSIVESGNARTLAIQQAYRDNLPGAAKYREALKAQGFDLSGFRNPILIRRRTGQMTSEDRAAFTREANERSTLAMSATEQAQADAKALPAHMLDFYQGGDIGSAANRDFVRKFMDTVAPAERASMIGEHGELSQEGLRRIEAAAFAKAYEAPDVLAALREDQDSNIRAIGNAMVDVAPAWARMRADAANGTIRPEVDATPDLLAAVRLIRQSRQSGKPLLDLVNQRDAFAPEISPATRGFLDLMYRDKDLRKPASSKAVADALRFYTEEAGRKKAAAGLFGDEPTQGPADILKAAQRRRDGGLFGNDELTPGIAAEARRPGREPGPAPITQMVQRGRAAVDEVIRTRGSKLAAMVRNDVGLITFDWGRPGTLEKRYLDGFGLSHIIARRDLEGGHGEEFVRQRLPEILAHGKLDIIKGPPHGRRAEIVMGEDRAVLSMHRHGARETWVLTGFGPRKGSSGEPVGVNPRDLRTEGPGVSRTVGAEPSPNVGPEAEGGKPLESRGPAGNGPGRNYLGFVQDQPGGVSREDPLRRETILRKFVKGMGAPLYFDRIQGKRVLGFYRPKLEEVRIKYANDIETTAHEMAHLLDDRVAEIRKQWNPATNANKAVRDELRGISYDASKLYEGFAEFVRHWMTQPHEAQARAPEFYKWFEGFVNRSPYGPTIREAQKGMTEWFGQDALTRARSKVGPAGKAINSGLTSVWTDIRRAVFDDLHGIARMERDIKGDLPNGGAYVTARLLRGVSAKIEGAMRYGAPVIQADGSVRFQGKGLEAILKPVSDDLDNFLLYAVGRSSSELLAQGREHLFTRTEVAAMRGLETPAFKQAFDDYQTWNHSILNYAQKKGIIDPNVRRKWARTQYLPFYRVGEAGGGAGFQQVNGAFSGIKALTGGSENIRDVLDNMIRNTAMLIRAADENEARQKVANLAALHRGAHFMAKIPSEERIIKVHAEEVRARILEALGVRQMQQLTPEQQAVIDDIVDGMKPLAEFTLRGQSPTGRNIMAVLRAGKPVYYEVADPTLMRALQAFNRPTRDWLWSALAKVKGVGQLSVTLSLDFMAANVARDTIMGSIMSKHGFRPIIDSAKGMTSRLTRDEAYKEFLANGGGFASELLDQRKFRVHLERFYGRKGIDYRTVLDSPRKLLEAAENVAEAFEVSTRLGEYRRAREAGLGPREAAFQAREISTDFAMRGDWPVIGFFYDTVPFLKAAMVSVDRAYRGFMQDSNKGHIWAKTALLATASAGLAALNFGNPLYDQLEDWDKDSHWHFYIPTVETIRAWHDGRPLPALEDRYVHLRFPKLWEIGAISSLAERAVERVIADHPQKLWGDAARILQNTFGVSWLPQAVRPLYEQATNNLQFFNRPIVTEGMKDRQPFAQYNEYTSPTMKALGRATKDLPPGMQISPARAEALLKGYLNTWAVYGLGLSDALFFDKEPSMRLDQYPVLRRFYEGEPNVHSRYVTELYDTLRQATEARRSMSFLAKSYGPQDETVQSLANSPENMRYRQMTFVDKRMQVFNHEMELVSGAESLDEVRSLVANHAKMERDPKFLQGAQFSKAWQDEAALKRYLLDRLISDRNTFARSVMQTVEHPPAARAGARH